ncbi:hypothetical protein DFH06DRAFT_1322438 [Mycena polygramma]|nr:hypothetical protein DFH06DRAFT_1322438 [Mycena polygramma]
MSQVKSAAEEYFKRDQFPATLLDAREYGYHGLHDADSESSGSDSSTSSNDSDSDDEDSDSGEDKKWKHRFKEKLAAKKKARKTKEAHKEQKSGRNQAPVTREEEERTTKFGKETNEVEEIIERLNTMNIRDPHYGAVYYKALKMDPLVAHCIQREPLKIKESIPPVGPPPFQRQNPPHMDNNPRQSWNVEAGGPATFPNNIPQGERPYAPGCFGCGKEDHCINQCSALANLTERGIIRRNPDTQRFTMRDGYSIRRQGTETLAEAAERQGRPLNMFWKSAPILQDVGTTLEKQVIGFYWDANGKQRKHEAKDSATDNEEESEIESEWEEAEISEPDTSTSEEESREEYSNNEAAPDEDREAGSEDNVDPESDDETGYNTFQVWAPAEIDQLKSADVFEADRTVPTTRAARKLAFDGVLMPPLKPGLKPKTRVSAAASKNQKEGDGKIPARLQSVRIPEKGGKDRTVKPQPIPEKKKTALADVPVQVPYDARPHKPATGKELRDVEMKDVSVRRPHEGTNTLGPRLDATAPLQHKKTRSAPGQAAAARAQAVSDEARRAYDNCMKAPVMSTVDDATVCLDATTCKPDHQDGATAPQEEYISLQFPLVFDHHRLFPRLFVTLPTSTTFHSNFMNELRHATRPSGPRRGTSPVLPQLPPSHSPDEHLYRAEQESASLARTLPTEEAIPTVPTPTRLPHFALVTDEASRMTQVQFLNRDTFGEVGPVQRSGQGLTAYQVLYNAAARVREKYRLGEPPESHPLSVTSAQCEYLGVERDPYGREGHAFALLNTDVTGSNTEREEPFSLNGHAKLTLYTPPPAPSIPWALEVPYPSRNAIRYALQDFVLPRRPFFAFPLHSTSIQPALDYFHPPPPPLHPPGFEQPVNPEIPPSPSPNHPRLTTCVPAIEADTREIGRAINDCAIAHFASQLPVLFDYIHRHEAESSSDVDILGPLLGVSHPTLPEHNRLLLAFDDTGIPAVPKESSDYSPSPESDVPAPPTATVVQIPDPEDRFSRPVARYSAIVHNENDYDRLAQVAASMDRDAREWGRRVITHDLDSWQERHVARRDPQPEVLPPDLNPSITAKKPQIIRSAQYPTLDDDNALSSSSSDSDSEYLQYYADLGSSDSDEENSSSDDELLLRPLRPSEEGDSYFPLVLPAPSRTLSRDPRPRPELPGGRPLMSYPSVDALLQRGPNPILPGGRPLFNSSLSANSMPDLQSVSNSSDDDEDESDRGEELVTAPTPDPWDDNSSEESIQFSSDDDIPLFDSELQYPPSPVPRPVLSLRTPPPHLNLLPTSPCLATLLSPHDAFLDSISLPPIAVPDDPREPPFVWTDDQARMSWISRALNEEGRLKRSTSSSALTHSPLSHTPALRTLSLSPPPPTVDSLINLRHTTPIPRPPSPRSMTRVFRRFTHAALTGAEHVLRNITTAAQALPPNGDRSYQRLDERPLQDPSTRFPFDEELDEWATASNKLAVLLAEHLKEPSVFRAEVTSTIDTDLLLGFSQGITDESKSYQSFSVIPVPSPIPSPIPGRASIVERPPHTPCPSPTFLDTIDPLRIHVPRAGSPITEEGDAWVDRIFDFDLDFGSDSSTQDSESAAAHKSIDEDDVPWAPPSRRPMRNKCGLVTYDRRRYGVVDQTLGDGIWDWGDRRQHEAIGYALEFPDHFVLFSQSHLDAQLLPNLHIRDFNETEQRMRVLEADRLRDQHQRLANPESNLRSPFSPEDHEELRRLPACFSIWHQQEPEDVDGLMGPFLRFLVTVEKEHAINTPLSPITRSSRYVPISASSFLDTLSSPESDAAPARRRKVGDSPLTRYVLRAETFKAAIIHWQPQFEELRLLRGDIQHGIARLIEVIDFLGLRDPYRAIFFPFAERFAVTTPGEMFRMEQERNPDGYFRRTSYHHNSLLHDAEVNFLQSCAILFRQEEIFDLAYCIEELLTTRFRDDLGIAQLLRDGFLDARIDNPEAITNQNFGSLSDRLREMTDDWYPTSGARIYC